jgi:hypothetical protein
LVFFLSEAGGSVCDGLEQGAVAAEAWLKDVQGGVVMVDGVHDPADDLGGAGLVQGLDAGSPGVQDLSGDTGAVLLLALLAFAAVED